jgi:outer membrane receptor protein involved in Fe transport
MPRRSSIAAVPVLLAASVVIAASPPTEIDPLLDLELAALLEVPVASAGLSSTPLRDVAALADVLTAEQLRAHGVSTLAEAIALLPGIQLQQRQTFTNGYASVHGAAVNDNDNHLLLLVDGVPWRVSTSGGANRLLYDAFPVALVERIELVRGQAAIVHGSNAVSGVVNIVTRDPGEATRRLVAGSRDGAPVGHVQARWGEGDRALVAFAGREWGVRDWSQENFAIGLRSGGNLRVAGDMAQSADALALLGRWDDTRLQAFAMRSASITPSSLQFGAVYVPPARDESFGLRLEDQRTIGAWRLHLGAAADRSALEYDTLRGHGERQSLRLALESPGGEALRGYAGVQAAWSGGRVDGVVPDWRMREWGAFAQVFGRVGEDIEVGAGLQHQRVADGGSGTTPQASLVWAPEGPWRLKLLRGESFRDADARERFSNAVFQLGHPGLAPEQGRTDAVELAWEGERIGLVARGFDQRIEDLIVLAPTSAGRLQFTNRGEARVAGSDVQLRWASGGLRVDAAWRHLTRLRDTQAPRDLVKLQGTWQDGAGWVAGVAVEAASASPTSSRLQASRPVLNPPASGYALVDAHVEMPLGRWWPALGERSALSLRLRNAFDREVWQPTAVPPINTMPYLPGRSWRLALSLPF